VIRRRLIVGVSTLVVVLALTASAMAVYWDYQANLAPGVAYAESNPGTTWFIRLSRAADGPKIRLLKTGGGSTLPPMTSNDVGIMYDGSFYGASQCEGAITTVFTNCRIDSSI